VTGTQLQKLQQRLKINRNEDGGKKHQQTPTSTTETTTQDDDLYTFTKYN